MNKKSILLLLLLPLSLCTGCVTAGNSFCRFYQPQTPPVDISNAVLSEAEPTIYSGSNVYSDSQKMQEDGYSLLGTSSFNAGGAGNSGFFNACSVSTPQLIAQAKRVHATVAILYSRYMNTITGSIPLIFPNTTTVTTNSSGVGFNSGNIYGLNRPVSYSGSGSYYGSSTSTINGTSTTYLPYAEDRYEYLATFWIKMKRPIFGAVIDDLSPDLRQAIGSNKGVIINVVVKDSPAFAADLVKGDVIKKINSVEIVDRGTLHELFPKLVGQEISVELLRNGKSITKQVKLNTPEAPSGIQNIRK